MSRPQNGSISAITRMQSVLLIIAIIVAAIGVGYYYYPSEPTTLNRIKVAMTSDAVTLDIHDFSSNDVAGSILLCMFERLIGLNERTELVPRLATSWESRENATIWIIQLRKNVVFHDGTPFNAAAAKSNIDRLIAETDPYLGRPVRKRSNAAMIKSVEVVDEYAVKIVLKYPYSTFPLALTHPALSFESPTNLEKYKGEIGKHPVGTGPFTFVRWEKGVEIVLNKNLNYWEEKARVDQLVFVPIPEAVTRTAALLAGDVDIVGWLSYSDVSLVEARPELKLKWIPGGRTTSLALVNKVSPFNDTRVRQAVNYAINKEEVVEKVFAGLATVSDSPFSPSVPQYANVGYYEYNPEKAKALLSEAGYPDGFKVELGTTVGRYPMDKEVSEVVKEQLAKVGIDVEIRLMDWATWNAEAMLPATAKEFRILSFCSLTFFVDYTIQNNYAKQAFPPNGYNLAFYHSDEVYGELMKGLSCPTLEEGSTYVTNAARMLFEDAAMAWICSPAFIWVARNNIKGLWASYLCYVSVRDAYIVS